MIGQVVDDIDIESALLRAGPRGILARDLTPCDGRVAGARLRHLRTAGWACGAPLGAPNRWTAGPVLVARRVADAAAAVSAPPVLALPAPPRSGRARWEHIGFNACRRIMESFLRHQWGVAQGPPRSMTMFATFDAHDIEREWDAGQENLIVWLGDSLMLVLRRRDFRGARYDRAMQELAMKWADGTLTIFEFAVEDE